MLSSSDFFKDEGQCTLLNLNKGYLETQQSSKFEKLFALGQHWLKDGGVTPEMITKEENIWKQHLEEWKDKEFERIFVRDAERCFLQTSNRTTLMHILTILSKRQGDYHQGLGLIVGFLLLTIEPPAVLALCTEADTQARYLPGIWKAASIVSATDGYVFQKLVSEELPKIGEALATKQILPETYVQKWFCALSVHVLPFASLFTFFSQFWKEGHLFLFRFGLALMSKLGQQIMNAKEQHIVYAVLRLEDGFSGVEISPDTISSILEPEHLKSFDSVIATLPDQLPRLRVELYEKFLKSRVEAGRQEEAETVLCQFCSNNDAESYCANCEKYICDDCRDDDVDGHIDDEHICGMDKEEAEEMLAEMLADEAAEAVASVSV